MSLGREIHNELRTTCQVGVLYYQHISYFQFFFPTDIMIYTEILRESLLKLQSYPLTHYANYINRVDQGDKIDDAMDELGDDYTEDEIRLVRIKFISEMAN